jgi:MFS superfamily sulfate permease-like transporter
MTGLIAALIVGSLAVFGSGLLVYVPDAALAGVLLFVAQRILQLRLFQAVLRESRGEFVLILATAAAIIVLPIEDGVAIGILLSLLYGIWTTTRTRVVVFERVPGTSIWWPTNKDIAGEKLPRVLVVGFQAPLSFLNADDFRRGFSEAISHAAAPLALVVLEAGSIVEIDFTAAHVLKETIERVRGNGALFALARLESVRAQEALQRFGITELVGPDYIHRSVAEAVAALLPADGSQTRDTTPK